MKRLARVVQFQVSIVARLWLRLFFALRIRYQGSREHGVVVYAANHRSFADPPMVSIWVREPLAFFARASLWRVAPIRMFLNLFGGIPVERDNPSASSMTGAVQRLREGWPILVFPEGTRTRTGRIGPMREGAALFARRAGVAVIPVYVQRSEALWPRGWPLPAWWGVRMGVTFGPALRAPAHLSPREQDRWVTLRIQAWMLRQEARAMGLPRRRSSNDPRA